MTTSSQMHPWRRDITGLRAVAVLPVLVFHAFPELMPGGFFGVDIFFVISGYLISGIIFRGLADGSFSYAGFYAKRIRRIIPNLLLVLVFVLAVGWFCLLPEEYSNLGRHIYSSAAFMQNFRLLGEIGYFTEDALRKPLLHLWSLAIEEQFYIFFPILCFVAWHLWRSKKALGILALLVTVCSLAACMLVSDRSFAFYFPLTRFWEIGSGILLAYVETFRLLEPRRLAPGLRSALSVAALAAMLFSMLFYRDVWPHPGGITLLPVLSAVLLIAAAPDALVNRTLLAWRPMSFIGLISYSLYLWHWPLLAFLFICLPDIPAGLRIGALIVSFVISTAVYFLVENPMRRLRSIGRVPAVAVLSALLVVVFALGEGLRFGHGLPGRTAVSSEMEAVRLSEWGPHNSARHVSYQGESLPVTLPGDRPPLVLFAGDSHAAQYFARAKVLSERTDLQTVFIATGDGRVLDRGHPNEQTRAFYAALEDRNIRTLILAQKWGGRLHRQGAEFRAYMTDLKTQLQKRPDLRVYVLLDTPYEELPGSQGRTDPLRHYNRISGESNFIVRMEELPSEWKEGNDWVRQCLSGTATFIDPAPFVWPDGRCDVLHWFRDDDHFQPARLEKEGVWLDRAYGL